MYECKDEYRDTKHLILADKKIQAKYKNKISYHLTISFLPKNTTMRFIQNAHTTFFTCEKNIVQPIKTLIRQTSHVKNIMCSENVKYEFYFGRILHVNLYTHVLIFYMC